MSATNVGTLLWQSRTRIVVVVLIVIVWIMLRFRGSESTAGSIAHAVLEPSTILYIALGGVVAYLLATVAVYVYARRRKKAGAGLVIAALVMDVALLFLATVLTTPIGYFERALLISIFVLQFALLYRGMTTAVVTGVVVSAMYAGLLLLASRVGYDLQWNQEIWTLILFLAAVFGMLALQGNASRRLEHLAFLFERMQSGDFSERYDERRDRQPDTVTYVGRAYNRMRIRLAHIVQTDPLSGCLNRRGFEEEFSRQLARSVRSREPLAVIALDLDFFKQVNDSYGHLVGDEVLRELGELLRTEARAGDVVGRLGGEEFGVLLPNTDEEGAVQLATRLVDAVRKRRFSGLERSHTLTASAGVVSDIVTSEAMAEDLRGRADEALYAAKRSGRDRVVSWSLGMARGGLISATDTIPA